MSALLALLAAASLADAQVVEVPTFNVGYGYYPRPSVAVGNDGTFTVVWQYQLGSGASGRWGYARRFAFDGTPLSDPIRIDEPGYLEQPQIAPLPGGGYVISYVRAGSSYHLYGRVLDSTASPAGAPFRVDTASGRVYAGAVASLPTGPVFVWDQGDALWARRMNSTGQALEAPVLVEAGNDGFREEVMPFPGGGYLVNWFNFQLQQTRSRRYGSNGSPFGPAFTSGQFLGAAAVSSTGVIAVVSWYADVTVSRFASDGTPLGPPTVIETLPYPPSIPSFDLDFDTTGNLYVVWSLYDGDVGYLPVRIRVLDTNGEPTAPTVTVANWTGYDLRTARIADERFVNVWEQSAGPVFGNVVSICGLAPTGCGDGVVDPRCEQCDNGSANSDTQPDACRTDCKPAHCGDGVVDSGEQCDDGNTVGGDGCDSHCSPEVCGNGVIEGGEQCDDGNTVDADGCDSNCKPTGCGNGVLTPPEECDDGNGANGDGCDAACLIESCGNGRIEGGEECDDGNVTDADGCDSNCTTTRCGNGVLTPPEECDDGANVNGDGCDRLCLIEECGNGRQEDGEECDDGNVVTGDGCDSDCRLTPRVDSVLSPVNPVKINIPASETSATKEFSVRLRNVDPSGLQILRLTAAPGTCPADIIAAAPDFDRSIPGSQDTVALVPGQRATARVALRLTRGSFPAVDRAVPHRCALELSAGPAGLGTVEATLDNSRVSVVIDAVDRAAVANGSPEFYGRSPRPVQIRIPKGALAIERDVHVRASAIAPGASFGFAVSDGDCPSGSTRVSAQDAAGSATVTVRASRAFFTTPNALSPGRCTAVVTVSAQGDTDASNNTLPLAIDVTDQNDAP